MSALEEIHDLERDWRLTLRQPKGTERTRQLRLIQQQREGLWAKRRRELAGYTYGRSHPGSKANHSKANPDPDPLKDLEGLVDGVFGPPPQKPLADTAGQSIGNMPPKPLQAPNEFCKNSGMPSVIDSPSALSPGE